ncbi:MAG: N-acetylmuramoyl-L-alanine amidase [Thermoanaerobaculia bacterium]
MGVLIAAVLVGSSLLAGEVIQAPFGPAATIRLESDQEISLWVTPERGDAWSRLSLRYTGDASNWRELARLNGQGSTLHAGQSVRIPLVMLREEMQLEAIRALFPADRRSEKGWRHKVVAGSSVEGESLWTIAEWFTGDGANYARIRDANPGRVLSTRRGEWIVVPDEVLNPPFRSAKVDVLQIAEDDPDTQPERVATGRVAEIAEVSSGDIQLEYHRGTSRPYAVYKLRQGEALYSSVAIRFTGRVYARDVNEVVDEIVRFNGIEDVSKMRVNYPVRIPMELLTAEWRPSDDPKRLARERTQRESANLARRVLGSASLSGVHIVIDPGHGGRDVGTAHEDVWESTYVYDVAARLKKTIESKTDAKVTLTTKSRSREYRIPDRDVLDPIRDHEVLTSPRYSLEDPVVGVNLRWYLANSVLRRAIAASAPPEKVVFLSIHADSLHPSLRGAMAYIPGERWVKGTFTKTGPIYLARAEVRESPTVSQSDTEALLAEGLSTRLAESIIDSFRKQELKVHPYQPVRDNVVRQGREWVPAVIRYNKIPARLLLEVCNLGNPEDRRLMKTRAFRQEVAEAIHDGIVEFFIDDEGTGVRTAAR